MKRFFCVLLANILLLTGCARNSKQKKAVRYDKKSEIQTVDSVHYEQSRKEAAFLHLRRKPTATNKEESDQMHEVRCIEARCADISVPMHAHPVECYCMQSNDGSLSLVYDIVLPLDTILDFFSHEMERTGWHEAKLYNHYEHTLLYSKPDKKCVISVRPSTHKSQRTHRVVITQFCVQS